LTIELIASIIWELMCGSESNVAVLVHPLLKRQPLETRILARSSLAALLDYVLPFWVASSTLLNLLLLFPFEHLNRSVLRFALIAFGPQAAAVSFSRVAQVPINHGIAKWKSDSLLGDCSRQKNCWDVYHLASTRGPIAAFAPFRIRLAAECIGG
jgi:hypothetical protein